MHQYMSGRFSAAPSAVRYTRGRHRLSMGRASPCCSRGGSGRTWALTLRVPHWAPDAAVELNGERYDSGAADGWLRIRREWLRGDELVLDLPLRPRFTRADPRVDADRGLIAVERGPLVYCVESADQPGQRLDDIVIDPDSQPVIGEPLPALGRHHHPPADGGETPPRFPPPGGPTRATGRRPNHLPAAPP